MGLDIKFNLALAKQAGMVVTKEIQGSPEDIERVEDEVANNVCEDVKEYLEWLKSEVTYGEIAGYSYKFVIDECSDGDVFVRANKWGNLYEPLTSFLKVNNIHWGEF